MENQRPKYVFEAALLIAFVLIHICLWAYNQSTQTIPAVALSVSLVLIIGMVIILAVVLVTELYGRFTNNHDATYEFISLVRLIGYPALAFSVLGTLGVNVTNILVGAGFLGVVIGLAAQTTLGNLFAGFAILYTKPFRVGDKIAVSTAQYSAQSPSHPHGILEVEVTGFVKAIGMMHTRLLRDDMTVIYIPNSAINVGLITNYSKAAERLIVLRADMDRRINTKELKKRLEKAYASKEFSQIKDLGLNTAAITTDTDVGIIVTARVSQLNYHKMREAMADKLNEVIRKAKA
jgi:small-conductance mechanosensitive channel